VVRSVLFYGVMTIGAAFLAAFARLPSLFTAPEGDRGVASLALAVLLSALVVLGGRRLEGQVWYARMGDVLRPVVRLLVGPRAGPPELFLLAASSGIGEEALFRGALQPWLIRIFERYVVSSEALALAMGISAATLLFTALHPPLHKDLRPWTIFALVIGFALGGLAAWSGSLAAPVLAHFLMNFFNLRRLLEDPSRC